MFPGHFLPGNQWVSTFVAAGEGALFIRETCTGSWQGTVKFVFNNFIGPEKVPQNREVTSACKQSCCCAHSVGDSFISTGVPLVDNTQQN